MPQIAQQPDVIILDDPEHGFFYSKLKKFKERTKVLLDSFRWQCFVIALIVVDACLVGCDIILAQVYCADEHPPHAVHVSEQTLRLGSIAILSFFLLEWAFEAWVHGVQRFARGLHLVDLIIICISLSLEIIAEVLDQQAAEIGGLLVTFRLWRLVRVLHAFGEVTHKEHQVVLQKLVEDRERLKNVMTAHHTIIRELQLEYAQKIKSANSAIKAATRGDQEALGGMEDLFDELNTAPDETHHDPVIANEPDTRLHPMLHRVSLRNAAFRDSITLHRESLGWKLPSLNDDGTEKQP